MTGPSKTPDPHAKPTGNPEKIDSKWNDQKIRGIEAKNETAEIFAKNGYEIEQRPKVLESDGVSLDKKPDYRIEGEIFDCYTPDNPNKNVRGVWTEVQKKVNEGQTQRVVINLQKSQWNGNVDELIKQFKDWEISGLKEVFIVDVDGSILRIFP